MTGRSILMTSRRMRIIMSSQRQSLVLLPIIFNSTIVPSFRILRQDDFNFLHRMPEAQRNQFRKMVIELVLATDMGEHMVLLPHMSFESDHNTGHRVKAEDKPAQENGKSGRSDRGRAS